VAAIHNVLRQFLAAGGSDMPKQVVCLGAGFDTTYFQKKVRPPKRTSACRVCVCDEVNGNNSQLDQLAVAVQSEGWLGDNVVFYELDFGEVVKRKTTTISTCRELHQLVAHGDGGIHVTEGPARPLASDPMRVVSYSHVRRVQMGCTQRTITCSLQT
jgi:hypothetical protein